MKYFTKNKIIFFPQSKHDYIFLVEDVYASIIPIICSYITSTKLIYSISDFGRSYADDVASIGKLTGMFYVIYRSILEKILIKKADFFLVRSLNMFKDVKIATKGNQKQVFYLPPRSNLLTKNCKKENEIMKNINEDGKIIAIMLGDFGYKPNYDAGIYIVENLSIYASRYIPELLFLLVGNKSDSKEFMNVRNNVIAVGEVEDIDVYLNKSQIGLAPSLFHGGTSAKIIDYLTHGLIVLATQESSSGIIENNNIIIKDLADFERGLLEVVSIVKKRIEEGNEKQINNLIKIHYQSDIWLKHVTNEIKKRSF